MAAKPTLPAALTVKRLDDLMRNSSTKARIRRLGAALVQRYPDDADVADLSRLARLHADEVAVLELEAVALRDERDAARCTASVLCGVVARQA